MTTFLSRIESPRRFIFLGICTHQEKGRPPGVESRPNRMSLKLLPFKGWEIAVAFKAKDGLFFTLNQLGVGSSRQSYGTRSETGSY